MTRTILFCVYFLHTFLFGFLFLQAAQNKKSMVVTIPKSGTNLLKKCLTLMKIDGIMFSHIKGGPSNSLTDINNPISKSLIKVFEANQEKIIVRHLLHTPAAEDFITKNTRANLFIIRDPRSQLVSAAFAAKNHRIGGDKRSIEDLLLDFINARNENFLFMRKHAQFPKILQHQVLLKLDLLWRVGALGFYKLFTPWIQAKNFYTVRFENLVGAQGGGTIEAQHQEIKNIAQHLGVNRTEQEIKDIAKNLFGGTHTFREGKIDSWKQQFTPAVKEAFKANSGLMQILVDLGYEKDESW
jgi:sulfotransferase family protein